ncbi:MAG: GrpB family protein [Thauera sp.]|jgi:GrpB-like predicted nucleotidyltransferase (UPF0157 family)|nr:GrpB family protein [Thauera sp.]
MSRKTSTPASVPERAAHEAVEIVASDPAWPAAFAAEEAELRRLLPAEWIGRIEHFGSTAVPGLAAKPIIDILLEVPSLETVAERIAPVLTGEGYEYFWRAKDPGRPGVDYAWFIRRDALGRRTHHIHCLPPQDEGWERLLFRDYLRSHPALAAEYGALKQRLAERAGEDRRAYAEGKSAFIERVMKMARQQR